MQEVKEKRCKVNNRGPGLGFMSLMKNVVPHQQSWCHDTVSTMLCDTLTHMYSRIQLTSAAV